MRNLFKCGQCKYNRDCYGGNGPYSNQFRHCRLEDEIIQENKAMRKLLEWADECGFTFNQIWDENFLDKKEFEKHTKDLNNALRKYVR